MRVLEKLQQGSRRLTFRNPPSVVYLPVANN